MTTTNGNPADTFAISVRANLTREFLWDAMTTAVESSYEWFGFTDVQRNPSNGEHGVTDHGLLVTGFMAHELDDDGSPLSCTPIDAEKISKAMEKLLAGGVAHAANTAALFEACASNDASSIDMDVADCILQVACFDEIRYG
jgi:hypothetical protein